VSCGLFVPQFLLLPDRDNGGTCLGVMLVEQECMKITKHVSYDYLMMVLLFYR
jgi:hypothetical protein